MARTFPWSDVAGLRSVAGLAVLARVEAFRVVISKHGRAWWWTSKSCYLKLRLVDTLKSNGGWYRREDLEPSPGSRVWVRYRTMETMAYYDGEVALERHGCLAKFEEAIVEWEELVATGVDFERLGFITAEDVDDVVG